MSKFKDKDKDTTAYYECPKCQSRDLRGPIDSRPAQASGRLTRAWFCRHCWWDTSITLRDPSVLTPKAVDKHRDRRTRA